jgi:diketogulonate reductase-like aldo/keto reductase
MIGDALDEIFDEGKYKREDLFITTKVWPTKNCNALDILRKSLKELRLTYVDLFLVHWPALYSEPPAKIINKPQHIIWSENTIYFLIYSLNNKIGMKWKNA